MVEVFVIHLDLACLCWLYVFCLKEINLISHCVKLFAKKDIPRKVRQYYRDRFKSMGLLLKEDIFLCFFLPLVHCYVLVYYLLLTTSCEKIKKQFSVIQRCTAKHYCYLRLIRCELSNFLKILIITKHTKFIKNLVVLTSFLYR